MSVNMRRDAYYLCEVITGLTVPAFSSSSTSSSTANSRPSTKESTLRPTSRDASSLPDDWPCLEQTDTLEATTARQLILRSGNLRYRAPLPSRALNVFVSATTDSLAERNSLIQRGYTRLVEEARYHGLQFNAYDLSWSLSGECIDDHVTTLVAERCLQSCLQSRCLTFLVGLDTKSIYLSLTPTPALPTKGVVFPPDVYVIIPIIIGIVCIGTYLDR